MRLSRRIHSLSDHLALRQPKQLRTTPVSRFAPPRRAAAVRTIRPAPSPLEGMATTPRPRPSARGRGTAVATDVTCSRTLSRLSQSAAV